MGFQDRDYYRDSYSVRREPMKIVYKIIILNVVLWLANALFTPPHAEQYIDPQTHQRYIIGTSGTITETLALHVSDVYKPWMYWKFITYGFAHSSTSAWHIIGNMLGLFFLGWYVEDRYGSKQFLGFYLTSIVFSGLFWVFCTWLEGSLSPDNPSAIVGASGGVVSTIILFAVTYPHVTLVLFPIPIPMPAWLLGVLLVGQDIYGAYTGRGIMTGGNVAFTAHIGGAVFAAMYYFFNWNLSRIGALFMGDFGNVFRGTSTPHLRTYRDDRYNDDDDEYLYKSRNSNTFSTDYNSESDSRNYAQREKDARLEAELRDEVDRILRKISMTGRSSLTRAEERTLQTASEYFQKHR